MFNGRTCSAGAQRRGFGLGNTLLVVSVVSTLAFTVAAASLAHLNYTTRVSNGEQAQNLADSTISLAIERLLTTADFGANRASDASLELKGDRGVGRLSFNQTVARDWGIDYSTNNLEGSNPVLGVDVQRPIPKAATQLIATATVGGVSRTVETVLYVPPFPYAVACAGPFHSTGRLEVGAVNQLASIQSLTELDPARLLAAHLASNAVGEQAMVLGPESIIRGDVRSAGQIQMDNTVEIDGEVRSGSDPVSIPKENVASYDPELLGKPNLQILTPGTVAAPTYQGFAKVTGDMTVDNGLRLDDGVLFVNGNLVVNGGLQGSGALFVTKNLTITGSSTLSTDNTVAIMAGGDVSMVGGGSYSSAFQGLMYTEGNFTARQISLMGVFIQNNPNATVEISDAKLIYAPEYSSVTVNVANTSPADFSLANANIFLDRHVHEFRYGDDWGDHGPVVFEAYPITSPPGAWQLVDPNSKQILTLPSYDALRDQIVAIWNAAPKSNNTGKKNEGGVLKGLLNAGGDELGYVVTPIDDDSKRQKMYDALDAQLAGLQPREAGNSSMAPPRDPVDQVKVDPSRFMSLKDRARVLYWRAR